VTRAALAASCILAACVTACAGDPALQVGDTGPGGGTVFYVADVPFPCGERLETTCTHLEAAPPDAERRLPWSGQGNHDADVEGAEHADIGGGAANSVAITAVPGNETGTAAAWARDYEHGGKTDWYLPASEELEELCKYAHGNATGDPTEVCNNEGLLSPDFTPDDYWSSTEQGPARARIVDIERGGTGTIFKPSSYLARPIRAF